MNHVNCLHYFGYSYKTTVYYCKPNEYSFIIRNEIINNNIMFDIYKLLQVATKKIRESLIHAWANRVKL
jgi:hypothetical protein